MTDTFKAADPVGAIAERLAAISYLTDDDWFVVEDESADPECTEHDVRAGQRSVGGGATVFTRICHTEQGEAAATFVAEAPRDIRWLLIENERLNADLRAAASGETP